MQTNHMDAAEVAFFNRELEQVKSRSYDVLKTPLNANALIPVDSTTSPGAKTVTYEQHDGTGIAKIISNYADGLPTADVKGKQFTSTLKSIGNVYEFSIEDVRAAQFAGKPLEQRKANSALRAHAELMNKLAFFGDDDYGIQGWLTNANIPASAVADNAGGTSKLWINKTADEILEDLNEAVRSIRTVSKGAERPNAIVLPISQYQMIANRARSATSDTTILQFFKNNNPGIEVSEAEELAGAFAGDTDGFIVYEKNIDKIWQEVPQMFEQFAAQWDNLAYKIPCHSKHGGTIVPYPLAQRFRYGI